MGSLKRKAHRLSVNSVVQRLARSVELTAFFLSRVFCQVFKAYIDITCSLYKSSPSATFYLEVCF